MKKPALLVLEDGSVFRGCAMGVPGKAVGEVVFNTAMTGYQEILTDPSYAQQIVTLTYPHIGNVGTNSEDEESAQVWSAGLVIRDESLVASNWRSQQSLQAYLEEHGVVGIAGIDTRRLTRILREKGAQNGCIMTTQLDEAAALSAAQAFAGLNNLDLAKEVTTKTSYTWSSPSWQLEGGQDERPESELPHHVVVYDFGVKRNILRMMVDRGCRLTVVPAKTSAEDILKMKPDAVFLSNGPGDPAPCDYAIAAIRTLLEKNMPLFGICLGHQLLALASGAKTLKMKFGHHGANHPIEDLASKTVMISSQNHGFAVDESSLPSNVQVTHRSLFDNTIQGIRLSDKPAFSFQGHPEASPGPHDVANLFDQFVEMIRQQAEKSDAVATTDGGLAA